MFGISRNLLSPNSHRYYVILKYLNNIFFWMPESTSDSSPTWSSSFPVTNNLSFLLYFLSPFFFYVIFPDTWDRKVTVGLNVSSYFISHINQSWILTILTSKISHIRYVYCIPMATAAVQSSCGFLRPLPQSPEGIPYTYLAHSIPFYTCHQRIKCFS